MNTAVVVLAAGESRRFDGFKLLADVCGEPVVVRSVRSAASAGVGPVYVVVGHNAEAVRTAIERRGLHVAFVYNPWYGLGLSTSLKAALISAPFFERYIIALGDMPLVRPDTYRRLLAHGDAADIVYPTYRGVRGNPVLIRRSVLPKVLDIQGDMGIRAIMGASKSIGVEVDDPGILIDVDNKRDMTAVCGWE
ncbi:MAG: nucleotidyltransferase family protein [Thermoproteus sp.]